MLLAHSAYNQIGKSIYFLLPLQLEIITGKSWHMNLKRSIIMVVDAAVVCFYVWDRDTPDKVYILV